MEEIFCATPALVAHHPGNDVQPDHAQESEQLEGSGCAGILISPICVYVIFEPDFHLRPLELRVNEYQMINKSVHILPLSYSLQNYIYI